LPDEFKFALIFLVLFVSRQKERITYRIFLLPATVLFNIVGNKTARRIYNMLQVTETAQQKLIEAINGNQDKEKPLGIRVLAQARSPFQVQYGLAFVSAKTANETDTVLNLTDLNIYIDKESTRYFEEVTLDFEDGISGSGFKFLNVPRVPKEYKGTLAEKVVQIIDEQINPGIAGHGGYVSLVDVRGSEVIIQMGGGCQGCGMANVTLKHGVEATLKQLLPEITAVYDVTDHADGKNPYYRS
jgi:Fe/S biogenesis protein NfuA